MKRREFLGVAAGLAAIADVCALDARIESADVLTAADREWICEHAVEFEATAKSALVREQARIILLYEEQLRRTLRRRHSSAEADRG